MSSIPKQEGLICVSRRGAAGHEPENTLLSVSKALELGASCIEVDVRCVEEQLLVFHDSRLERTTNGFGPLHEKSLAELRSLDAGKGEKIPLLKEVLDLVNRQAEIIIELQEAQATLPLVSLIDEDIKNRGSNHRDFIISSYDHHELHKLQRMLPEVRTSALVWGVPFDYAAQPKRLGAYSVEIDVEAVNSSFVEDAHERNLRVFVYTINSLKELEQVRALGVDGVFTDYPELALGSYIEFDTPDGPGWL